MFTKILLLQTQKPRIKKMEVFLYQSVTKFKLYVVINL